MKAAEYRGADSLLEPMPFHNSWISDQPGCPHRPVFEAEIKEVIRDLQHLPPSEAIG